MGIELTRDEYEVEIAEWRIAYLEYDCEVLFMALKDAVAENKRLHGALSRIANCEEYRAASEIAREALEGK